MAAAGQMPHERAPPDPVHQQPALLSGDVDPGLRDDLLVVRVLELPADVPVVVHVSGQLW